MNAAMLVAARAMTRIEPGCSAPKTSESIVSAKKLPWSRHLKRHPGAQRCAEFSSVSVSPPQRYAAAFKNCDEQNSRHESPDVRAERDPTLSLAGNLRAAGEGHHELQTEPRGEHPHRRESSDLHDQESDRQP